MKWHNLAVIIASVVAPFIFTDNSEAKECFVAKNIPCVAKDPANCPSIDPNTIFYKIDKLDNWIEEPEANLFGLFRRLRDKGCTLFRVNKPLINDPVFNKAINEERGVIVILPLG